MLIVEVKVLFLKPEEEKDKTHFTDKEVNMKVFYTLYMKMCDFLIFALWYIGCCCSVCYDNSGSRSRAASVWLNG